MAYLIILLGAFLGGIMFAFVYIASKKSEKYYMAPIVTFLVTIAIVAYSIMVARGWEGLTYLFWAGGFFIATIVGTILMPLIIRRKNARRFMKKDKVSLIILPVLFLATIGLVIYSDKGYWVIEQGKKPHIENTPDNYYEIEPLIGSRKQVELTLGEEYKGKEIEVDKVSKWGATEITLDIIDGGNAEKVPYIVIGVDDLKEPLTIQTTEGEVFEELEDETKE